MIDLFDKTVLEAIGSKILKRYETIALTESNSRAAAVCHFQYTLFTSNWEIGITGYASPVPESGQALFVYYAIACYNK
ncbi:MAG: hypothetical protein QM768_19275 [Agriterribacter sp.]